MNILITGINRGLGLEITKQIFSRSDSIHILGTSRRLLKNSIYTFGIKETSSLKVESVELNDPKSIQSFLDKIINSDFLPDIVIHNAGVYPGGSNPIYNPEIIFQVNFYAVKEISDKLIPLMKKKSKFIFMSSGMGELSQFSETARRKLLNPNISIMELESTIHDYIHNRYTGWPTNPYSASKAALNTLCRIYSHKYSDKTFVSICPGWVKTDMGGPSAPREISKGAETPVWAVFHTKLKSGLFYRDKLKIPW
ncbi:MAG: SDR family NAD(P)-dependent oxidoreductase [Leptospiraceae bacterium]|nr:SDR family NAD(P)-dependent oxidoreductase [Leptospiraceae bacterium]MCP5512806.1 SDR family NAD(P)-dependent oxidoreductase [Leptospiraceae bacterium]